MKKNIFAAITFLTTGVLLYLVQIDGTPSRVISSSDEAGVAETVVVEENAPEAPKELFFRNPETRDS